MAELQRLSAIESKCKEVEQSPNFTVSIDATEPIMSDLAHIRKCIVNGTPLPERFYRVGRDSSPDEALEKYGLMHLHVGEDRNDLLFLYQFDSAVIFAALTDHSPFREEPSGTTIHTVNKSAIAAWNEDHTKKSMDILKAKRDAIAAGLRRKPKKEE